MNKKISMKISNDKEFVLETMKTNLTEFIDAFLGYAF